MINYWSSSDNAHALRQRMCFLFGYDKNHAKRKVCPHCRAVFVDTTWNNQRVFCKRRCLSNYYAHIRWYKNHPKTERQCRRCRKAFLPVPRARHQVYCSERCMLQAKVEWTRQYRGYVHKEVTCKCGCGRALTQKRDSHVFFNRKCKARFAFRKINDARKLANFCKKQCRQCGATFMTTRPSKVFHSKECKRLHDNAKRKRLHDSVRDNCSVSAVA